MLQVLGAAYVFQYRFDEKRLVLLRVFHFSGSARLKCLCSSNRFRHPLEDAADQFGRPRGLVEIPEQAERVDQHRGLFEDVLLPVAPALSSDAQLRIGRPILRGFSI